MNGTKGNTVTPFAKCLLFSYAYLCLNVTVCLIVYAVEPEGNNRQLVITLRMYTTWGVVNGLIFILAMIGGKAFYKAVVSKIISYLNTLYEIINELIIVFLVMGVWSYLNAPYIMGLIYGGLNLYLNSTVNSLIEGIYSLMNNQVTSTIQMPTYMPIPSQAQTQAQAQMHIQAQSQIPIEYIEVLQ